jgi:Complex I intermediate-associated protein 30 (CIA30)
MCLGCVHRVAERAAWLQVRSRNFEPAFDLGGYEGLRATLRGDGQRYKLILRTSGAWDGMSYCASVDTPVCILASM